jgi:hypothetical protein
MNINISCFHCGNTYVVELDAPPYFAFEYAQLADAIGMKGFIDLENERAIAFCNDDHANAQRKKDGSFRLRPKKLIEGEKA